MPKKIESVIVFVIAIIAIVSLTFLITVYFKDIGNAVFGKPDCGCVQAENPVCGLDGVTYKNACIAICAGEGIEKPGECS